MIIHVVKEGDSLYEIGKAYNVDYKKIAADNEMPINQELVVGQTIVVITNENKKLGEIEVNGYAFPNIDRNVLEKTLPSLTYLSIFSYQVTENGSLSDINDEELIALAKSNRVSPVMVITNIGTEERFDGDLAHVILNSEDAQNKLIMNILNIMRSKGYRGLTIDFEYVYPDDRNAYIKFINKINSEISRHNYFLMVAIAPKTSDEQEGVLYEAHDYKKMGILADHAIIMTYEWGYAGGPAMAVAPLDSIIEVLDYAVTRIPPRKILMGIPNYGYDWTLPYVEGSTAQSIDNYEAIDIARKYRQRINYNAEDQAPYFYYYDSEKSKHEVWFDDARSIEAKLRLVDNYNLGGISYWTINRYSPQSYLILNYLFNIKKTA